MTEIRNVQPDLPDYDRILALYEQTFPENERIPWEMLMRSAARDGIHFRACYEERKPPARKSRAAHSRDS